MTEEIDRYWMQQALQLAEQASLNGEVPVGALVVHDNVVMGTGQNRSIQHPDPSAHAEIEAIREAARFLGNYRLVGTTLYVTLEPCVMCAGAIVHARIARVVFGAKDERTGACGSVWQLLQSPHLNHRARVQAGILEIPCSQLLKKFFQEKRQGVLC